MRRLFCHAFVAYLLVVHGALAAAEELTPQDVIDRAIKAAGGEEKLARLNAVTLKTQVDIKSVADLALESNCSFLELDKFLAESTIDGTMYRGGLTPEHCWRKAGDKVEHAVPTVPPIARKILYALRAAQLVTPLKSDQALALKLGGEEKVGDRPAVVLQAKHYQHGDFKFYFDSETGLPVKAVTAPIAKEPPAECVFSEYKETDGHRYFTKVTFAVELDQMRFAVDMTLSDIQPAAKLDAAMFAIPE